MAVAAATGLSGLLTYKPPPTELRAGTPVPVTARPVVTGPFTATPASIPGWPAPTTSTTAPPPVAPAVAPPATEAPATTVPPPPTDEPPAGAPVDVTYDPAFEPAYYEPEPDVGPEDDSAGPASNCNLYDGLLATLDDPALREAVATVGC